MFQVIRLTPVKIKIVNVTDVATQTVAEEPLNLADFWMTLNDFFIILSSGNTPENQRASLLDVIISHDDRRSMVLFNCRKFHNWCNRIDPLFYNWIDASFIKYY